MTTTAKPRNITNGLTALSDETPWTDIGDHGDPLDRIDAFNDGRIGGVVSCRSSG
ncbi:hypothetical protein [uncultured Microbacterium sp.]|uniref:hypothetical protein n=1 Tax=uncultured Microbacterium sp. TaxID=191216 RepID=UPI00260C2565|nr:hypothetical protein [uncultured Microbacterium sp.]